MAKIAGCHVIGSAGSSEKVSWLLDLGFDQVFSYRERSVREALGEAAPGGIDIYFDNVGGDHLEAAIGAMRDHGRIVACGSMSRYGDAEPVAPRNLFMLVTKRLRIEGFVISDHFDRFPEYLAKARECVREGRLRYHETVIGGMRTRRVHSSGFCGARASGRCS